MGDFQGHPFRGNQWTDRAGQGPRVSEGGGSEVTSSRSAWNLDDGESPTPDDNPTGEFDARAQKALAMMEFKIRVQSHETASVTDSKGFPILVKNGSNNAVGFTPEEVERFRGGVLTHNHPSDGPFSVDDMNLFLGRGLREIRAIGRKGTSYRFGSTKQLDEVDAMMVGDTFRRVMGDSMLRTNAKINAGRMTVEEANAQWPSEMHNILMEVVRRHKASGVYYKRIRRGPRG